MDPPTYVGQQVEHILNCMSIKESSFELLFTIVCPGVTIVKSQETGYCTTYSNP